MTPLNEALYKAGATLIRSRKHNVWRLPDGRIFCWGPRHQRAVYDEGVAVNVFQVLPPADWGVIMTIRTGPADFSRRLLTGQAFGGYMPYGMQVRDGALWQGSDRIPCPEERSFFSAIGLDWIEPGDRA